MNRVIEILKRRGFGIISDIDVAEILRKKINVEFRRYRILGACNPVFAYEALNLEDKIGTMLPCNVVVQETTSGEIKVAAVDPVASMQAINNPRLKDTAMTVRSMLKGAIEEI